MFLSNFWKDKNLVVVFGLCFLLFIFNFILVYLNLSDAPGPVVIHYDAYKGIDFIGSKLDVFGILLVGLAMIIVNLFLADFLYHRERFLSYLFGFSSLVLSILILIVVGVIVSVN